MADDDIIRGGLDIVTDKTKNKKKTFKKRKNCTRLTLRHSQKHYEIFSNNVLRKKHYPDTVKIGNNKDCVIQSWLSAWVVRDFISHSLNSVVA